MSFWHCKRLQLTVYMWFRLRRAVFTKYDYTNWPGPVRYGDTCALKCSAVQFGEVQFGVITGVWPAGRLLLTIWPSNHFDYMTTWSRKTIPLHWNNIFSLYIKINSNAKCLKCALFVLQSRMHSWDIVRLDSTTWSLALNSSSLPTWPCPWPCEGHINMHSQSKEGAFRMMMTVSVIAMNLAFLQAKIYLTLLHT